MARKSISFSTSVSGRRARSYSVRLASSVVGHCVGTAWLDLSSWSLTALDRSQKSKRAGGEAGSRGRLAVMAAHIRRKLSSLGRSPAPESRQTGSAPIRATAPLTEQYYVAVDRQLKS